MTPGDVPKLSWADVCARRIERHSLSAPLENARPSDVVGAMCGAHAQIMSAAELSVGMRLVGATRSDVRDALWSERSIIKTFGPRGTVHLLRAEDLAMWAGALSAVPPASQTFAKDIRMTPDQTGEVVECIAAALDGAELTIDELNEEVIARAGSWAGDPVMPAFGGMWPRWRQAMHLAANRGALCFGPNRGRKVTYTSPRRWIPGFRPAPSEAAMVELVRRFLYAYGPATPHNFAQWLAAPRSWAKELFDSISEELQKVEVEGELAWVAAGDDASASGGPRGLRLLPYFDAFVVGCHPREKLFPGRAGERALAGGQAGNFPVVLIDGVVAGVWHQRRAGRRINITVEPLDPPTAEHRRELDGEIARIGEILEGEPHLTIGAVSVGAHA